MAGGSSQVANTLDAIIEALTEDERERLIEQEAGQ